MSKFQNDDFDWFVEHYNELYQKYGHKHLVIKNQKVIGVYDSLLEGIKETKEELGTFLVQECNGDKSAYTIYSHKSNYFN